MKFLLLLLAAAALAQEGRAQEASIEQAIRMASEGRLPEAEAALRTHAARNPRDADSRYRLGLVLVKRKKLDEAARAIEDAAKLEPGSVFTWLALGDVRLRLADRAAAVSAAKRAGALAGASSAAWKALAVLEGRLGDAPGEWKALESVIRLAPGDRDAYVRLADLHIAQRSAEAARLVAEKGLVRFPSDAELLRLKGVALYGLGRKQEAIDAFLAAMDRAPGDEAVHASVETLLPDAGPRLRDVAERLRRFSELRPESPLGPFLLALIAEASADRETLLNLAIGKDAGFWPAYFEMHKTMREAGKRTMAIEALETTLRLNPNHEGAHFALAELYLEAGDREKAREHRMAHHRLRAASVPQ